MLIFCNPENWLFIIYVNNNLKEKIILFNLLVDIVI